QRRAVETRPLADCHELLRRLPRMSAAATADMDAQLRRARVERALERPDHASSDPRGVPVHAHDGAERLEPERMGEATQQLVAAIVMHDRFADYAAQPGHAVGQPARHMTAVQRQVGTAGPLRHLSGLLILLKAYAGGITEQ